MQCGRETSLCLHCFARFPPSGWCLWRCCSTRLSALDGVLQVALSGGCFSDSGHGRSFQENTPPGMVGAEGSKTGTLRLINSSRSSPCERALGSLKSQYRYLCVCVCVFVCLCVCVRHIHRMWLCDVRRGVGVGVGVGGWFADVLKSPSELYNMNPRLVFHGHE